MDKVNFKRGEDWDFLWINGQRPSDDEAEYPHKNEVFYIKMNYIEDATKVTDLAFYFEYMNAALRSMFCKVCKF